MIKMIRMEKNISMIKISTYNVISDPIPLKTIEKEMRANKGRFHAQSGTVMEWRPPSSPFDLHLSSAAMSRQENERITRVLK